MKTKLIERIRRAARTGLILAFVVPPSAGISVARAESGGLVASPTGLIRAMAREQSALAGGGSKRLRILSAASRPMARSKSGVTVAGRNAPATLTVAALDSMQKVSGDKQWQCLATAIYFESRGEPLAGQVAVAEVILNRVDSRHYPANICAVTNQGTSGKVCQFSYACDGRADVMKSPVPRDRAEKLAALMIAGHPRTVTSGATHFHANYVNPRWSRSFARTASIGQHLFYRMPTRTARR